MDESLHTSQVYEDDADAFVEKYRTESVAARFWDEVDSRFPGPRLLDVGCGPGVDTETFAARGYDPVGVDLTPAFCRAASEHVDGPVLRADMRSLPFADGAFDGVWASASVLHLPREDAPDALREFRRVLDAPGTALVTLKRGEESGHAEDDRYFERYTLEEARALGEAAGFPEVTAEPGEADEETGETWLSLVCRTRA